MDSRINKLISFLKEIEKYKIIEREMFTSNPNRTESDAEHSWHVAMFVIMFKKELSKEIDFTKTLELALMHDLVEIYAGDTFAFDKNKKFKKEREIKAANKLFSRLPDDLQKEFMDLFNEYEGSKTKEAKIIKSFDKIQPILQNLCSNGKSWKKNNIKYKDVDDYKRKHMLHDKTIFKIYNKLLQEAKDKDLI